MEKFTLIIQELSEAMDEPLAADPKLRCHIVINENLHVQLESDQNQENILVLALIGEVPPGKFLE